LPKSISLYFKEKISLILLPEIFSQKLKDLKQTDLAEIMTTIKKIAIQLGIVRLLEKVHPVKLY
jgi:hypothetical protein